MKEHGTKKGQHTDSSIMRENVAVEPKQNLQKNMLYLNIKAKMLELIAVAYKYDLLTRQVMEGREESGTVENLKKVLQYIGEHYGSPIRLSELAELVNMNEQYREDDHRIYQYDPCGESGNGTCRDRG